MLLLLPRWFSTVLSFLTLRRCASSPAHMIRCPFSFAPWQVLPSRFSLNTERHICFHDRTAVGSHVQESGCHLRYNFYGYLRQEKARACGEAGRGTAEEKGISGFRLFCNREAISRVNGKKQETYATARAVSHSNTAPEKVFSLFL